MLFPLKHSFFVHVCSFGTVQMQLMAGILHVCTSSFPPMLMYTQTLDLTNPATFRDFSLPMGAQDRLRLKRFIERYNLTKEDPTGTHTYICYLLTWDCKSYIRIIYLLRKRHSICSITDFVPNIAVNSNHEGLIMRGDQQLTL